MSGSLIYVQKKNNIPISDMAWQDNTAAAISSATVVLFVRVSRLFLPDMTQH